jgi:Domain of Unknown Function (DUF1206)
VSFGILGILAIKLAVGDGGKATSRQGALQSIANHPFGKALLILLALGFAAYAIWRFVQAFAEREEDAGTSGEAKKWVKRAGYVGVVRQRDKVAPGRRPLAARVVASE